MAPNYEAFLNDQIKTMRASPTFAIAAKAKARRDAGLTVFDFSIGQPAEPTPEFLRVKLREIIDDDGKWKIASGYPPVGGLLETRQVVAEKFAHENGITYDPKTEIMLSTGGKQAIYNAFAVSLQEGDSVLIPEPSWVSYADMVKFLKAKPVGLRTNDEFKFNAETLTLALQANPDAKWLVLNSPSNPTGTVYTLDEMNNIATVVLAENRKREQAGKAPLMVLSDDIYEHMVYEEQYLNKHGDAAAIANNIIMANAQMKPYTVIANGTAKAFAMTGWRIGYAAGPRALISKMSDFQGLVTSGGAAIAQLIAKEALSYAPENKAARQAFFTAQKKSYTKRRDLVASLINDGTTSMSFTPTPGAFYAMIDCTELAKKVGGCHKLADKMIEEYGVALVPGDDFFVEPAKQGKTYLRMSFATDEKTIRDGIAAMKQAAKDIIPDGQERAPVAARS